MKLYAVRMLTFIISTQNVNFGNNFGRNCNFTKYVWQCYRVSEPGLTNHGGNNNVLSLIVALSDVCQTFISIWKSLAIKPNESRKKLLVVPSTVGAVSYTHLTLPTKA